MLNYQQATEATIDSLINQIHLEHLALEAERSRNRWLVLLGTVMLCTALVVGFFLGRDQASKALSAMQYARGDHGACEMVCRYFNDDGEAGKYVVTNKPATFEWGGGISPELRP